MSGSSLNTYRVNLSDIVVGFRKKIPSVALWATKPEKYDF